MNLSTTIEIHAGGPGSGCRGDDCGRKPISLGPNGVHTKAGAEELVAFLNGNVPGAKFKVVGSVAKKGTSNHDLDITVKTTADHQNLHDAMKKHGFEWVGTTTVSPDEAKGFRGYIPRSRWSTIEQFENSETGHHVDFWY